MPTSEVEKFLRVEDEANHLLDVLEQLRDETQSYRTSRAVLDATTKVLDGLANNIADVTKQLISLREALQSISTSDLLGAQEAVIDQVNGLRTELHASQRSIAEKIDQLAARAFEQTATQLSALQQS